MFPNCQFTNSCCCCCCRRRGGCDCDCDCDCGCVVVVVVVVFLLVFLSHILTWILEYFKLMLESLLGLLVVSTTQFEQYTHASKWLKISPKSFGVKIRHL